MTVIINKLSPENPITQHKLGEFVSKVLNQAREKDIESLEKMLTADKTLNIKQIKYVINFVKRFCFEPINIEYK